MNNIIAGNLRNELDAVGVTCRLTPPVVEDELSERDIAVEDIVRPVNLRREEGTAQIRLAVWDPKAV